MANAREPTLDEILSEPIIRKIMAVDGYSSDDIRYLMRQAGAGKPFVKILKPTSVEVALQRLPILATLYVVCLLPVLDLTARSRA